MSVPVNFNIVKWNEGPFTELEENVDNLIKYVIVILMYVFEAKYKLEFYLFPGLGCVYSYRRSGSCLILTISAFPLTFLLNDVYVID